MINTTLGEMDEAKLVRTAGVIDNDNERTEWVEYRLPGSDEIIHRSVAMVLKKGIFGESASGGV